MLDMPEAALAPDPSTNSMPAGDPAAMAPPVVDDPDWGDEEAPTLPPARFRDESEEEEALADPAEAEAQKAAAEAEAQKAAAEAKAVEEAKVAETERLKQAQQEQQKQAQTPDDIEVLKKESALFRQFDKALDDNPAAVFNALLNKMNPIDRAALLKEHIQENTYPDFNADEYEPQGEMEEALRNRWVEIESIPEIAREARDLNTRITALETQRGETMDARQLIPHVTEAAITAEIAIAKLEALCDFLGIDLPDPDPKELQAVFDSKENYRSNVRKVTGKYKDAVEAKKQANAPRPRTPANGTHRAPTLKVGASALEIARSMGTV